MKLKTASAFRTRLLLSAGALFLGLMAVPAAAGFAQSSSETSQLMGRINQLENQIQTLSRTVYRGKTPPGYSGGAASRSPDAVEAVPLSGGGGSSSVIADYESRLAQLEQQQRDMTGQLERIAYDMQELKTRVDKTLADNDMRFRQMEGGGATSSSSYAPSARDIYPDESSQGRSLGQLSSSGSATPDGLYESAFADIRESKYDAAEKKLADFMTKYASHPLAANAQYWLAETFYVRGDYRQSAKMFAQGYQDYPQGAKAPDSLLKLGLSLSKLGKKEDACLSFTQLKKQFPGDASPVIRRAEQEMKQIGC